MYIFLIQNIFAYIIKMNIVFKAILIIVCLLLIFMLILHFRPASSSAATPGLASTGTASASSATAGPPMYACPSGYSLIGTQCYKNCQPNEIDMGKQCEMREAVTPILSIPATPLMGQAPGLLSMTPVLFNCPSGSTKSGQYCYTCPPALLNSVFDPGTKNCLACPDGYQSQPDLTCHMAPTMYNKQLLNAGSG